MANKNPNTAGLVGFEERTANEQRKIAQQGGVASGVSRRKKARKKAELYERINLLRSLPLDSKRPLDELGAEIDSIMTAKGKNPDIETSVLLVVAQKALSGDERCMKLFLEYMEKADAVIKAEQEEKERKRQEKKKAKEGITGEGANAFIQALSGVAKEVFTDGADPSEEPPEREL